MFLINQFINSYQVIKSKDGSPIPIINEIHLHSTYSPKKEALKFVESNKSNLKEKNSVLIFGLGFGYHVIEIKNYLKKHHKSYSILVIDPNKKNYLNAIKYNPELQSKNISFYIDDNIENLYNEKNLINQFIQKPCVINHAPSFNLYSPFFKDFLKYEAKSEIFKYLHLIELNEFSEYLSTKIANNSRFSIDNLICKKIAKENSVQNKNDFLLLAFHEIVSNKSDSFLIQDD